MPKADTKTTRTRRRLPKDAAATAAPAEPAGADAELIRLCNRLVANRALEQAAYRANPDNDDEREITTGPLNEEWFELRDRLFDLDSPRTREGARAVALAALSECPRDKDAILYEGLHTWLSLGCAEYLATPAIAVPVDADAALLDLCRQFDADTRKLFRNDRLTEAECAADPTLSIGDDDLNALLDGWGETLKQITALPATTGPGIRAKGCALGHAMMQCVFAEIDANIDEQGQEYEKLAMSLVRDLAAVPV